MAQGSNQYLEVDLQASSAYGSDATENNGFPAGESAFATENSSPNWLGVEIFDDGFGMSPQAVRNQAAVKANLDFQRPGQITGIDANGTVNPVPAPYSSATGYDRSVLSWMLGAGLNRDTSDGLRSYSMRWTTPGIVTEKFLGCKMSTLTIEGSEDSGNLDFTGEWIAAAYSTADAEAGPPTFPFTLKQTAAASVTAAEPSVGWTFARAYIAIDGVPYASLRSVSVTNNNNLTAASPKVQTVCDASGSRDIFVIGEIREGTPTITGNFVIDAVANSKTFIDKLLTDASVSIVILGRHSQSNCFSLDTADGIQQAAADVADNWSLTDADTTFTLRPGYGSLLGVTLAGDDFGLYDGGAIMVENTAPEGGGNVLSFERDIAVINTPVTAGGVVVADSGYAYWEPLGTAFNVGAADDFDDYIVYDQVVGIRIDNAKIDTAPFEGGPSDVLGQNVSFQASQFDSAVPAIQWVTGDPGNYKA